MISSMVMAPYDEAPGGAVPSVASNPAGAPHDDATEAAAVDPTDATSAARRDALRGTALKRFNRGVRRAARDGGREVILVLENINYPVNVGSLFRIADGCGARVVLAGTTPDPTTPSAAKVARGHHVHLGWTRTDDVVAQLRRLASDGWWVAAIELAADSVPYHAVAYPPKVALVLGNEDHGVTRRALNACHAALYVPMLGRGASLNVHVAAAIVAYRALFPSEASSPST